MSASTPATTATKLNGLSLAGFIVSLVGFFLILTTWPATLVGLVGLVLSIVGKLQVNRTGQRGNGLAIAGIIIGALAVVLSIVWLVAALAIAGNAGQIQQQLQNQ